jgi:hypothetical protein
MKTIVLISMFLLIQTSVASAQTVLNCQTENYVISIPAHKMDSNNVNEALHLIKSPNLQIKEQHTSSLGRILTLVSKKNQSSQLSLNALMQIEGVRVTCETFYYPNPRLTGTN